MTEPCSNENQITYLCFCTMGALTNSKLAKVMHKNGSYTYFTYHLRRY